MGLLRPLPPGARRRVALVALALTLWAAPARAADCRGTIHLTFDTGNMSQAEAIARILAEERVTATFFLANEFLANERTVRGDHALDEAWAPFWRARVLEGHAFGNHTWSHHSARRDLEGERVQAVSVGGQPLQLDRAGFCEELGKVERAFQALTGTRPGGIWRAPGGRTTQQTVRWAASCGYPVHVHWDDAGFIGDELPSDRHPNEALLRRALDRLRAGDVVMMHLGVRDRREPAAPILRPLIQGLRQRGFCFAPLAAPAR